jgi:hypothetical protein
MSILGIAWTLTECLIPLVITTAFSLTFTCQILRLLIAPAGIKPVFLLYLRTANMLSLSSLLLLR